MIWLKFYTSDIKKKKKKNCYERLGGGGGFKIIFLMFKPTILNKIAIHDNLELEFEVC